MHTQPVTDLIKKHEGFRAKPYRDSVGKLTIGYGRNLEENGISQYEAEMLLASDIQNCYADCSRLPGWNTLNEARQAVLLDMCYNLGLARLKNFKKMLAALTLADFAAAAREMLDSRWARQVKTRAVELAEIMKTGEMK